MAQPSDAEYSPHSRRQTESLGTGSARRGRPYRSVRPLDGATGRHWRARRGAHAKSKALIREREENYFKDRPAFNCQPSGPEPMAGWRRIIQTPSLIAIAYETLTYRLIFMDGRKLEADPERTWMGYSVGRWEGDTLVVDSFGFNDRTWLDARGLPHTEALRTTERYRRRNVGQLQVELTVTDPGAFAKPWT